MSDTSEPSPEPSPAPVHVVHRFAAPPERVFDAWLDPATVGRWLFATPTGTVTHVAIDARVGGAWAIVDRRDGEDVRHDGTYAAIDRPHRLVFSFGVPRHSPDRARVTVAIAPQDDGGALLTLTQTLAPHLLEYADRTRAGWARILAALAATLGE